MSSTGYFDLLVCGYFRTCAHTDFSHSLNCPYVYRCVQCVVCLPRLIMRISGLPCVVEFDIHKRTYRVIRSSWFLYAHATAICGVRDVVNKVGLSKDMQVRIGIKEPSSKVEYDGIFSFLKVSKVGKVGDVGSFYQPYIWLWKSSTTGEVEVHTISSSRRVTFPDRQEHFVYESWRGRMRDSMSRETVLPLFVNNVAYQSPYPRIYHYCNLRVSAGRVFYEDLVNLVLNYDGHVFACIENVCNMYQLH